jgi:hypothetical protein
MKDVLNITYPTLQTVLGTGRKQKSYWQANGSSGYFIWVQADEFVCMCSVPAGADATHYETNYKARGQEVAHQSDAIVLGQRELGILVRPKTHDGKLQVSPDIFPGGVALYVAGVGDNTGVGDGQIFNASSEEAGDVNVEFGFKDWVYAAGGGITCEGGQIGDYVDLKIYCPANVVEESVDNTGNCNKVSLGGGLNLIVPAAGNGAFDIDLAEASPVPAEGNDGYWDWSEPDTGRGTITALPGVGKYNIIEQQIPLSSFVRKFPLIADGLIDITIPALKPKKVLPHWKWVFTLHNSGHTGLKVGWYLMTARVKSS